MKKYFAIILYRCYIESEYTGDVDFCCRYFEKNSADEVRLAIQENKESEYANGDGEKVKWVFDEIIQIDEVENLSSGCEVVGFIGNEGEFIQRVSESKIENIRKRYEAQQEESVSINQVRKDVTALLHEIARLNTLVIKA